MKATIASPVDVAAAAVISTCTAVYHGAEVHFELRNDGHCFRWYYPDNSSTGLYRGTEDEARRAMMFRAPEFAREYVVRSAR